MGTKRILLAILVAALVAAASPRAANADGSSAPTMLAYLNQLRASVGAPAAREDSRVDAAAQAHATYDALNGIVGHYESAGAAGYTGYAPKDRLAAQGYFATFVSEVAASYDSWPTAMTELWAAPYHRLGMMHPHNIVAGWGHSDANGHESTVGDFVYDFSSAAPAVVRSPAAGQVGVPTSWNGNESPSPLPAGASRPTGYPLMLVESNARTTVLQSASLVRASDGAGVPLYLGAQQFEYDYAFVIPQAPLQNATTYRVTMDLTVSGQPTTESWSFTTSTTGSLQLTSFHTAWASQTGVGALAPGATATFTVRLQNTGNATWQKGVAGAQVNLGVKGDSTWWSDSGLAVGWLMANRPATTSETTVAPGGFGTFTFAVRAPSVPGTYRIPLRPVIDGVAWLEDQGIYVELPVVSPFHSAWVGESPWTTLHPGDLTTLSVTFRNTGAAAWNRGVALQQANLGVANDDTTWASFGVGWLAGSRPATTQESSVLPGQTGTFAFQMRAPATPGVYDVHVRPVIDGVTWMEDQGVFLRVIVAP